MPVEYIKPVKTNNNEESKHHVEPTPTRNLRELETSFDKQKPEEMRVVVSKALETTYDKEQPVERPHIKLPAINPTYTTTLDKEIPYVPQKRITPSFVESYGSPDITESSLPHNWNFYVKDDKRYPQTADSSSPSNYTDDFFTSSRSPTQRRFKFDQPKRSPIERPYYSMPNLPFIGDITPSRKPPVPRFPHKSPTAPATIGGTLGFSQDTSASMTPASAN